MFYSYITLLLSSGKICDYFSGSYTEKAFLRRMKGGGIMGEEGRGGGAKEGEINGE